MWFTRRIQRLFKQFAIGACALLVLAFILSLIRSSPPLSSPFSPRDSAEDDSFYHAFDIPNNEEGIKAILNGAGRKPVFQSGRRRTLNTSEGVIHIKDVLFEPKNPPPKGANVYQQLDKLPGGHKPGSQVFSQMKQRDISKLFDKFGRVSRDSMLPEERGKESMALGERQQSQQHEGEQKKDVVDGKCYEAPCKNFLTLQDSPHFKYCRKKARIRSEHEPSATSCRFRKVTADTPLVALAAPMGSGASTLRWLLQEVTGLCTGSIYCNINLRRSGYAGECIRSASVLMVASDQVDPFWSGVVPSSLKVPRGFSKIIDVPVFSKAVYLLRNPFEAILEAWSQSKVTNGNDKIGELQEVIVVQISWPSKSRKEGILPGSHALSFTLLVLIISSMENIMGIVLLIRGQYVA